MEGITIMKKFLKILLPVAMFSLLLTGCNKKKSDSGSNTPTPSGDDDSGQVTPPDDGGNTPVIVLKDDAINIVVSDKTYDGVNISVTASSTSGRTPVLSYKQGDNAIASAPKNAGEYAVYATLPATGEWKAANATKSFTINQNEVELVWTAPANLTYDGQAKVPSVGIKATSIVSGDTVEVSSSLTPNGDNVNPGTFTFTATGLSNPNYKLPSSPLSPEYTIGKGTPTYEVPTGLVASYGQTLADVTLPEGFAFQDPLTTSVGNAGKNKFLVTYTPAETSKYNSVSNIEVTINVGKVDPVFDIPTNITATYGDLLLDVVLPTGFNFTDPLYNTVGDAGEHKFNAVYTPDDTVNYNLVEFQLTVQVNKANPEYELPTNLQSKVGQKLGDIALPEGFAWEEDANTLVGNVGDNTHNVYFTPEDTQNYNVIHNLPVNISTTKGDRDPVIIHLNDYEYFTGMTFGEFSLPIGYVSLMENPTSTYVPGIGTYEIPVECRLDPDNYNYMQTIAVVKVVRGTPSYVVPEFTATYGDTLGDIDLTGNEFFSFEDDLNTSVGSVGEHYFPMRYFNGNDDYKAVEHIQVKVTVSRANNSITGLNAVGKVYDGSPIETPTFTQLSDGTATFSYRLDGESEYHDGLPVNVGSYFIKVNIAASATHNAIEDEMTSPISITKAQPTINFKETFKTVYASGENVIVNENSYTYNGDGEVTVKYKVADGSMFGGYTDTVPTADGVYYISLTAAESNNVLNCYTYATITIGELLDPHVIEITNGNEINRDYNGTAIPHVEVTVDGVAKDLNNGFKYYTREVGKTIWTENGTPIYAGTYELRVIAEADASHRETVLETTFTIGKATPIEGTDYVVPSFSGTCIQTLGDFVGSDGGRQDSKLKGYWYFEDPLTTPLGSAGNHEFLMTFVRNPISDHYNYKDVVHVPVTFTVSKAPAPSIVYGPDIKLGQRIKDVVELQDNWVYQNPSIANYLITTNDVLYGYFNIYFTASETEEYQSGTTRMILNVLKGPRGYHFRSSYYDEEEDALIFPYSDDVVDIISNCAIVDNDHASVPSNIDQYSFVLDYYNLESSTPPERTIEFKEVGESDGQYVGRWPSQVGDYVMRITLAETNAYEQVVITKNVKIIEPPVIHTYVDEEAGVTYVLRGTPSGGSVDVYGYTNKTLEELENLSPISSKGEYGWGRCSDDLEEYLGEKIVAIFNDKGATNLFILEEGVLTQIDLPVIDYYYKEQYTGADSVEYYYLVGLGTFEDLGDAHVIMDLGDYEVEGFDINKVGIMEPNAGMTWEENNGLIEIIADDVYVPVPGYVFVADENNYISPYIAQADQLIDYGYITDGFFPQTVVIYEIGDKCYAYFDWDDQVAPENFENSIFDMNYPCIVHEEETCNVYEVRFDTAPDTWETVYFTIDDSSHDITYYDGEYHEIYVDNIAGVLCYYDFFGQMAYMEYQDNIIYSTVYFTSVVYNEENKTYTFSNDTKSVTIRYDAEDDAYYRILTDSAVLFTVIYDTYDPNWYDLYAFYEDGSVVFYSGEMGSEIDLLKGSIYDCACGYELLSEEDGVISYKIYFNADHSSYGIMRVDASTGKCIDFFVD